MTKQDTPDPITEEDGPFSYTYIAVLGVPGIRLHDSESELRLFSFSELNATAALTQNWDHYCHHIDRSSAIALLLLTAFRGRSRFKRLSAWTNKLRRKVCGIQSVFRRNLAREEKRVRESRHKERRSPGCYLVYQATGDLLEAPRLTAAKKVNSVGFGFDVVDGEKYRSIHRTALHGVATALSMVIEEGTGSPEMALISDIVYLNGADGLTIYSRRIEMGAVGIVTSTSPKSEELEQLARYIPLVVSDRRIETAISLFVQSHRRDGDNLRAFIAAWSALELLVNRFAKIIRADWELLLKTAELPDWDKDLVCVRPEDYRMRDRFYSVACTVDLESAKQDCAKFCQANDRRSGYYHRLDVREAELPTHDVRWLFRKYLGQALRHRRSVDSTIQ